MEKALGILELFNEARAQLTLSEVVALTGMNRVTTYRFCRTLEHLGYLESVADGAFRPGLKVLSLGHAALISRDLRQIAVPELERLRHETGHTANIAIRDGTDIVYLARVRSETILSIRLFEGSRLPVYCTSMGKAMLAFLPEAELDDVVRGITFERFTPSSVKNERELHNTLAKVRSDGYAVNDQELAPGLRGIAAPIFDYRGYPVAAINLATASAFSTRDFERLYAKKVIETAETISKMWAPLSSHSGGSAANIDVSENSTAGTRKRSR